ncbi:hypothetical protein ABI59_23820 [Acidobacteria bacterium Mor1]|nr:hypothetical protein ABI59_23820 [Acidobacteria bacterium Mor1]
MARAYVWSVILAGSALGVALIARGEPYHWDWSAIAVFGVLAVVSSTLTLSRRDHLPTRITHQVGAAFWQALFLIVGPAATCLPLWTSILADWGLNRRRPLTGFFNLAQLTLALAAGWGVRHLLDPGFEGLDSTAPWALIAAFASLVVLALINQLLTVVVTNLANRRPFYSLRPITRVGLLAELLCAVYGLTLALFWTINPWLLTLGIAPIGLLLLLLMMLSRREQELERHQADLDSLQGLGLEIGSELDEHRVRAAVVRTATDALQASGALLAAPDPQGKHLVVQAHLGLRPVPAATLPLSRFSDGFFETGQIRVVEDFEAQRDLYPDLRFLEGVSGVLCAPVRILGRRDALLVLTRGRRRRPFDDDDCKRLGTLVRFVNMALSNAQLVTEQKQLHEHLLQSEKISALGMLVSGVAHELKNPLTSVIGFCELLMMKESDPGKRRGLDKVRSEAHRSVRIVNQLLSFSRKRVVEKRLANVNDVLDRVIELKAHDLQMRNIELQRRYAPVLPPVWIDDHQFEQVFLNLVNNAEHALRDRDQPRRLIVETRAERERVGILFIDNGPGLPREQINQVFLPFFTTKPAGEGTGLGLSLCHGIVTEHGGSIDFDSAAGQGTTLRIEIPRADPTRIAEEQPRDEARGTARPAPGKLLVVEDDPTIGEMVDSYFRAQGWSVDVARDGFEALRKVGQTAYDALLVDLLMPGMDGRELYRRLHESRPDLARRIVFATGDLNDETNVAFLERRSNPVLTKPYTLDSLTDAIGALDDPGEGDVH